jgi:hypothetical protein
MAGGESVGVSFTLDGVHPHDIIIILDRDHVAIRTGFHHCAQSAASSGREEGAVTLKLTKNRVRADQEPFGAPAGAHVSARDPAKDYHNIPADLMAKVLQQLQGAGLTRTRARTAATPVRAPQKGS